jgi:PKD repeat protein
VIFTDKGLYTVKLTAANIGGTDDTVTNNAITISFGANTEGFQSNLLGVHPNPAVALVYLPAQYANKTYFLTDACGRMVLSGTVSESGINIESLPAGIYNLSIAEKAVKLCVVRE